jgi:hypothetical protein
MKSADCKLLKKQIEEQYQKAIALATKERLDGLAAVDTVWKMLHIPRPKRNKESLPPQNPETPTDSIPVVVEPPAVEYGDLRKNLKKALLLVTPDNFNGKDVATTMEKISGKVFKYSSITNELKKLAKEGVVEIIRQGHGRLLSEYRIKNLQLLNNTKIKEDL